MDVAIDSGGMLTWRMVLKKDAPMEGTEDDTAAEAPVRMHGL
jgi:hypothetical protein